MEGVDSFSPLCPDLQVTVFAKLPTADLVSVSQVCKAFHDVIYAEDADTALWQQNCVDQLSTLQLGEADPQCLYERVGSWRELNTLSYGSQIDSNADFADYIASLSCCLDYGSTSAVFSRELGSKTKDLFLWPANQISGLGAASSLIARCIGWKNEWMTNLGVVCSGSFVASWLATSSIENGQQTAQSRFEKSQEYLSELEGLQAINWAEVDYYVRDANALQGSLDSRLDKALRESDFLYNLCDLNFEKSGDARWKCLMFSRKIYCLRRVADANDIDSRDLKHIIDLLTSCWAEERNRLRDLAKEQIEAALNSKRDVFDLIIRRLGRLDVDKAMDQKDRIDYTREGIKSDFETAIKDISKGKPLSCEFVPLPKLQAGLVSEIEEMIALHEDL